MSLSKVRAKQIIQEELRRALRARRLNENYMDEMGAGHMMDDDVYEVSLDDEGMDMDEMYMDDEGAGMMDDDYDMDEGQHDNDLGAGDDALMETVRRRLAAARRRR